MGKYMTTNTGRNQWHVVSYKLSCEQLKFPVSRKGVLVTISVTVSYPTTRGIQ